MTLYLFKIEKISTFAACSDEHRVFVAQFSPMNFHLERRKNEQNNIFQLECTRSVDFT